MKRTFIVLSVAGLFLIGALVLVWILPQTSEDSTSDEETPSLKSQPKTSRSESSKRNVMPSKTSSVFPLIKDEAAFFKKYGRSWTINRNQDESIRRVFGAEIQLKEVSPQELTDFSRSIAGVFDLKPEDLEDVFQIDPLKKEGTISFIAPQIHTGYPVVGGEVRFYVDVDRRKVTGIDASNVVHFEGSLKENVRPIDEIIALAKNEEASLYITNQALSVIADQEQRPRLAYRGSTSPENSITPKTETVYVDAQTGEVLRREPVTNH